VTVALCRTCHTVIPCHCHIPPPTQIRPGVYLTASRPGFEFRIARRTTRVIVEAEQTEDPS
jgi:hypothetical protein